MLSKVLKSEEEFEDLKQMLAQDAKINGVEPYFDDDSPTEYPCLAKVHEINNVQMDINIDEDEDLEEVLESGEFEMNGCYIYDFIFISQREIKELLDA